VQDSTGPSAGRIRSMVESGRVTWDLCDSSASSSIVLGRANLVRKIDYSVVKKSDTIGPGFVLEWGAAPYSFSSVLVYDSAKFQQPPRNWADFWDLRRFPGTRLLRKDAVAVLEAAQMSLGKDPANLYPLDVPASLRRVSEIRRNAVYWTAARERAVHAHRRGGDGPDLAHPRARCWSRNERRIKRYGTRASCSRHLRHPARQPGRRPGAALLAACFGPGAAVRPLQFLGNGPPTRRRREVPASKRFNPRTRTTPVQVVLNGDGGASNYHRRNQRALDAIRADVPLRRRPSAPTRTACPPSASCARSSP
jgi:putative spermidine/putrescine transport system substrate-binding protein